MKNLTNIRKIKLIYSAGFMPQRMFRLRISDVQISDCGLSIADWINRQNRPPLQGYYNVFGTGHAFGAMPSAGAGKRSELQAEADDLYLPKAWHAGRLYRCEVLFEKRRFQVNGCALMEELSPTGGKFLSQFVSEVSQFIFKK